MSGNAALAGGLALAFLAAVVVAAAEAALLRLPSVRVDSLAEAAGRRGRRLAELVSILPRVLNAVLLTALLAQIAAATLAGILAERVFGSLGVTLASVVLTLLLFVYAEAIPKTFAIRHPERVALALAAPLAVLERLLRPVVSALLWVADQQLPGRGTELQPSITEDELRRLAGTAAEEGAITEVDREMIERAFRFGDRRCDDIMVPRSDIVGVPSDAGVERALEIALRAGHRRLVVFGSERDEIVGMVPIRTLVGAARQDPATRVREVMEQPLFVPASKRIVDLLGEMQRSGVHLAVVVDEYGGVAGLITVEDIAEELLGVMWEGYERPTVTIDEGRWIVDGLLPIEDLAELTGADLPTGPWNTAAGFVMARLGRVPVEGDELTIAGLTLRVVEMRRRRVTRLHVDRSE